MAESDLRPRLRLVLGGLRWRAGASVSLLLVATLAVTAAAFGPLYLSAADASVLQSAVRLANVGTTGLTLIPDAGPDGLGRLHQASAASATAVGSPRLFGHPIVTEDVGVTTMSTTTGQNYGTDLVARTGVCRHVVFVAGGCPSAVGTVAVSTRSARALGLRPGAPMTLALNRGHRSATLTVSGLFTAGNPQAATWWGANYFAFGFGTPTLPALDDVFASAATVQATAPADLIARQAQEPLVAPRLTPGDVASVTTALDAFTARSTSLFGVSASTGLTGVTTGAAAEEHTMGIIVLAVDLQLVLLCLLVLYFVAARTAETREPDVFLADLRGFGRGAAALVVVLEPLVLLALAVPLGIVLAWVAALICTPHLFVAGVAPTLGLSAVGAALVSFLAGVAATVLGARYLLGRRTSRRTGLRSSSTPAVAADAVAVVLAAVAFVEVAVAGVASGSHSDPLAALAPGLLAFGVGVLVARSLPLVAQAAVALTRHSHRTALAVTTRRLARRTELSRQVVLISLAVGLATFAVAGWATAGHNRVARAGFDVGAAHVLVVRVRPGVDFLTAVRAADPTGRQAMAAVVERAPDGTVLAVDTHRLAAVSSWPSTLSPLGVPTLARRLSPDTAPPVIITGTALRVAVDTMTRSTAPPELEAVLFDNSYQVSSIVDLGPLTPGAHVYQSSIAGDCAPSCRLVDLDLVWAPPQGAPEQTTTASVAVTAMADRTGDGPWSTLPAGLGNRRRWVSTTGVAIGSDGSALTLDAQLDADGAPATVGPADVPAVLPAVVTTGGDSSVGLDGATVAVRAVATVTALPGVGDANGATMVDLPLVERLQAGPMTDATPEVWVANGPDDGLVARLARRGIVVVASRSVTARVAVLSTGGVSLAYDLFLLTAVGAALLAAGSTVLAVAAAARRRTMEIASLAAVGIGRPTLRRCLSLEHAIVLGAGVAAGTVAGAVATVVALPSIPETFAPGAAPPLDFGFPVLAVAIVVASVVVALAVTVAVATRLVVAGAAVEMLGGER